jgi:hypothetical protein
MERVVKGEPLDYIRIKPYTTGQRERKLRVKHRPSLITPSIFLPVFVFFIIFYYIP